MPKAQLPLNVEDAEAIQYARQMVDRLKNSRFDFMGTEDIAALNKESGRRMVRDMLKRFGYKHVDNRAIIADYARDGWGTADEALREMWREMSSKGETCHYLNAYIADVTRGAIKRSPGQRKEDNFFRDVGVTALIIELMDRYGLRPTRNPTTQKRLSACAIVAQTMGMSEPAVVAIWHRLGPAV